jgi:hypothetical protein
VTEQLRLFSPMGFFSRLIAHLHVKKYYCQYVMDVLYLNRLALTHANTNWFLTTTERVNVCVCAWYKI